MNPFVLMGKVLNANPAEAAATARAKLSELGKKAWTSISRPAVAKRLGAALIGALLLVVLILGLRHAMRKSRASKEWMAVQGRSGRSERNSRTSRRGQGRRHGTASSRREPSLAIAPHQHWRAGMPTEFRDNEAIWKEYRALRDGLSARGKRAMTERVLPPLTQLVTADADYDRRPVVARDVAQAVRWADAVEAGLRRTCRVAKLLVTVRPGSGLGGCRQHYIPVEERQGLAMSRLLEAAETLARNVRCRAQPHGLPRGKRRSLDAALSARDTSMDDHDYGNLVTAARYAMAARTDAERLQALAKGRIAVRIQRRRAQDLA